MGKVLRNERQAERAYDHAVRKHEAKIERQRATRADALADPRVAASYGLPENLPEETRRILGFTQALDALEPNRPDPRHYQRGERKGPS